MTHNLTVTDYDCTRRVVHCYRCKWSAIVPLGQANATRAHAAHVLEARGGQMTLTEWREEVGA